MKRPTHSPVQLPSTTPPGAAAIHPTRRLIAVAVRVVAVAVIAVVITLVAGVVQLSFMSSGPPAASRTPLSVALPASTWQGSCAQADELARRLSLLSQPLGRTALRVEVTPLSACGHSRTLRQEPDVRQAQLTLTLTVAAWAATDRPLRHALVEALARSLAHYYPRASGEVMITTTQGRAALARWTPSGAVIVQEHR